MSSSFKLMQCRSDESLAKLSVSLAECDLEIGKYVLRDFAGKADFILVLVDEHDGQLFHPSSVKRKVFVGFALYAVSCIAFR